MGSGCIVAENATDRQAWTERIVEMKKEREEEKGSKERQINKEISKRQTLKPYLLSTVRNEFLVNSLYQHSVPVSLKQSSAQALCMMCGSVVCEGRLSCLGKCWHCCCVGRQA